MKNLPIYDVLDNIKETINKNSTLILQSPPGTGKSTIVPAALLDEPFLNNKMIIMLEPRRVAARMVAQRISSLLGENIGHRVGYQIKMDSCYCQDTKLLIVTEAILVRKLQLDPSLQDVAMVIFDEFHERNIHSDLSLALSLQVQEFLRDDLKIFIMSATLNQNSLLDLLGDVPVINVQAKSYDVKDIYLPSNIKQSDYKSINPLVLDTILKAFKKDEGDILVFLPGAKQINDLQQLLEDKISKIEVDILPLYSSLNKNLQDKALKKSNKRKIILSTNIAQTSLTIEGVKVVIDSGLHKISFYDYNTSMDHLKLQFISEDFAIQRAGRAGRLSNGVCYKLWHRGKILEKTTKPEILRSDLSQFFLNLALWGVDDIKELKFLDYPTIEVQNSTKKLLQELMMLNGEGKITPFGKKSLSLGVHPRFAYMILKANDLGFAYEACLLAALLSEKDIFKNHYKNSDIYARFIHLYGKDFDNSFINISLCKEVLKQAQYFYSKLKNIEKIKKSDIKIDQENLAVLLLFAYPDRLAKQREKNSNRYILSNAKGAILNFEDPLFNEKFLICPILNGHQKDSYINLALKISLESIKSRFKDYIKTKEQILYNSSNKKIEIKQSFLFNSLELYTKAISSKEKGDFSELFLQLIKKEGLNFLTWSKKAIDLKNRVVFINENSDLDFPNFKDEYLLQSLDIWLKPYLVGMKTLKELESLDLYSILLSSLPWEKQQLLDDLVPSYIKVPSRSKIKIDYSNSKKAILAVKIQEVFGLTNTPKILNNTMPLQIHLLSPALRVIQITEDIKSFWENSYEDVRKELFIKYKKHYWPNNPFEAIATNKLKKNMLNTKN